MQADRDSQATQSLRHRTVGAVRRYGLATLCAAAALIATRLLHDPLFPTPFFFAAIVTSTWYGGNIPGLLAVALATLSLNYYFIPPIGSMALNKPEFPFLFQFALPGLLTCWFVSKRRIAETALRRARDEAESRVEERQAELARVARVMTIGEVGVSVAHEVNQPLMAVVLNGDACLRWLNADPPNVAEARAAAVRIVEDGARAGEIIRRIRMLSGKSTGHRGPVDLNEIATEVATLLDRELTRNNVAFRLVLARDLPAVRGDRVQLQQVILNLAVNAIEAMAGAARPRELQLRTEPRAGGGAVVAVEDSGPGLPPGDPEQLFGAFFTTKQDGVGIGLSISRTIIEAHGGRLWASSSAAGAIFQFELPSAASP